MSPLFCILGLFVPFKRTLSVSSKVHAGINAFSKSINTDRGSIVKISLCMPRLHRIKIVDTFQVCEYPDSMVLTVLKWRMITTLNRKRLEKQRVYNCLEVHIGHFFFYNVNATLSFGNLSTFRFKNFSLD